MADPVFKLRTVKDCCSIFRKEERDKGQLLQASGHSVGILTSGQPPGLCLSVKSQVCSCHYRSPNKTQQGPSVKVNPGRFERAYSRTSLTWGQTLCLKHKDSREIKDGQAIFWASNVLTVLKLSNSVHEKTLQEFKR